MTEFLSALTLAWLQTSQLEVVSVVFGLAYVILAARENSACWPAAFIGTGTAIFLFWDASLLMESGLNVYYLLMAVYGWWQWQHGSDSSSTLAISSWSIKHHSAALLVIAFLTLASGAWLSSNTQAALPYVDSFTTWSAVITTWMVANKILQNWLYWIVIDAVSVWLYLERGLQLYAALFVIYTIIALLGYLYWRRRYIQHA